MRVASLSVADRALVSNAATISDAGASVTEVYSSSKVESLMDLVEAGISYKEACIAGTTAALPTCVYTIGPPGVLTGSVSGALPVIGGVAVLVADRVLVTLQTEARQNGIYDVTQLGDGLGPHPGIGHVMGVGDRLLVAQQADTRENGVYIVTALGSNSTPYVLTRAEESLVGGMALTVQQPISALVFLEGSTPLTVDDPVLANNDWVVFATPGAAVVPANLSIATLTCSGAASTAALDADAITGDSLNVTGVMNCGGASTVGGALTASAALNVTGLLTGGTISGSRVDCSGDLTGGHVYSASGGTAADIRIGFYDAARQTGFYNPAAYTLRFATGGADRVEMSNVGFSVLSGTKNFRIHHPLTPATMNLQHASVEGPEVLCYYRGRSVVGADGTVVAPLPAYWMALNCEPCYQLTSIGAAQPNLYIAAEVADSAGSIAFTRGWGG
jgi:hypothetical protein